MTRKNTMTNTDQRPFSMVYHDFLRSELLDNHYQVIVFIYLKMFADRNNQCYPSVKKLSKLTKIGISKIKSTIKELEEKHLVIKEHRTRPDGGYASNLYTIQDFKELWNARDKEEAEAAIEEYEENKLISMLEAKGYKVTKENREAMPVTKENIPEEKLTVTGETMPGKEKNVTGETMSVEELTLPEDTRIKEKMFAPESSKPTGTNNNNQPVNNDTTLLAKSQAEKYTLKQIKQFFDYNIMLHDAHGYKEHIDSVMSILHTTLNTAKKTIKINGGDKPAMVVIAKLMKLNKDLIMYAINKFSEQTNRIKNPVSYMLTILYNAPEQHHLDIQNHVQYDMAHWND